MHPFDIMKNDKLPDRYAIDQQASSLAADYFTGYSCALILGLNTIGL